MELHNISHETMAGVHSILLHCPSLTTLELKRTRLGYGGILYICSALRNNTTLRHLVIHDDLQLCRDRCNAGFRSYASEETLKYDFKNDSNTDMCTRLKSYKNRK